MRRTSVTEQLKIDYPGTEVDFDKNRNILQMDKHKISLLFGKDELEGVNIHSHSGRNYYQAITQLIYFRYDIVPKKGSFADSLITYKKDYNKFRLQNLARDYGIGFLEDGDEVIAVKISGDMEKPVMIEEDENLKHRLKKEQLEEIEAEKILKLKEEQNLGDDFAVLIELPNDAGVDVEEL